MYRRMLFFAIAALILAACGPRTEPAEETAVTPETPVGLLVLEEQQAFFNNLMRLCGQSFEGEQIYRSHHAPGWEGEELIMHVEVCEATHIQIPFHIGDDHSRTWIFLVEDGRLRFRHDHRYPDGTPEEETLYGGYADDTGTAFVQHFPADDYTAEVIDGGEGNVWTVKMDENMTTFTYRLERDGEKRLRVDFDLTRPL